ncbi:DUF421 domain-containing protein [Gracilibacillus sp. HCP3S3_G5_1]|uniref:DUF421 domain-containing protein n=1 Tax=unclassified Gracilibacillus TaxID=2625209 RepID=UPI003F886FEE
MDATITTKILIGFLVLMIVLRVMGKKELTQITPVDFVYLLVLGGLMENAVYDDTISIWEVIYAVALWSLLIYIFELLVRNFEWLRPIVKGQATIIIENGVLNIQNLRKNKLESEQLRSMLRLQGIFSIKDVKYAILEPSGDLSVMEKEQESVVTPKMLKIKPEEQTLSYLVIDEGEIEQSTLDSLKKDEKWLRDLLKKSGYETISNIYYAEWSESDGLTVNSYDNR